MALYPEVPGSTTAPTMPTVVSAPYTSLQTTAISVHVDQTSDGFLSQLSIPSPPGDSPEPSQYHEAQSPERPYPYPFCPKSIQQLEPSNQHICTTPGGNAHACLYPDCTCLTDELTRHVQSFPSASLSNTTLASSALPPPHESFPSTMMLPSVSPCYYELPLSAFSSSMLLYSSTTLFPGSSNSSSPSLPLPSIPSIQNTSTMPLYSPIPPVVPPAAEDSIAMASNSLAKRDIINLTMLNFETGMNLSIQNSLGEIQPQKRSSQSENNVLEQPMMTIGRAVQPLLAPLVQASTASLGKIYGEPFKKLPFCPWSNCHKTFTRPAHLARHIRSHGGEKPYACSQEGCGKHFSRSDVLKEHSRTHDVNKVRKSRGRNSEDQVKASVIKRNDASSAATAALLQQNAAQLSAIPPPLRRRTIGGLGAAPSTTFQSLFRPNGQMLSAPCPQFILQPLQQQPQYPYQDLNSPKDQCRPQYPSQQMPTMYGQEFAYPMQQPVQGLGDLDRGISAEVDQTQAQSCSWIMGPPPTSSPPAHDANAASRKDSLASLTDEFSTMDYFGCLTSAGGMVMMQ